MQHVFILLHKMRARFEEAASLRHTRIPCGVPEDSAALVVGDGHLPSGRPGAEAMLVGQHGGNFAPRFNFVTWELQALLLSTA